MVTSAGLQGFHPTPETQRAMQVRQALDKTCAELRHDPDLSDTGKIKAMCATWLKCVATLNEIRMTEVDKDTARQAELKFELYGVPSGPMGAADYRAALTTAAEAPQPKDALVLLGRANVVRDETLARAVACIAAERGWGGVLDQYAATRPGAQDILAELRWMTAEAGSATSRIGRDAIYNPNKPPELARYSDSMIRTLATQNDDPGATAGITARATAAFNTALGR